MVLIFYCHFFFGFLGIREEVRDCEEAGVLEREWW